MFLWKTTLYLSYIYICIVEVSIIEYCLLMASTYVEWFDFCSGEIFPLEFSNVFLKLVSDIVPLALYHVWKIISSITLFISFLFTITFMNLGVLLSCHCSYKRKKNNSLISYDFCITLISTLFCCCCSCW